MNQLVGHLGRDRRQQWAPTSLLHRDFNTCGKAPTEVTGGRRVCAVGNPPKLSHAVGNRQGATRAESVSGVACLTTQMGSAILWGLFPPERGGTLAGRRGLR